MTEAVRFAKEIMRKKDAVKRTQSKTLKKEWEKSISRDVKELRYYCDSKGLNMKEVVRRAKC